MVLNADTDGREVEPSGVDTHERGGVPPVMGAAVSMAKGTAGVEPARRAEKAATARPEALGPRVYEGRAQGTKGQGQGDTTGRGRASTQWAGKKATE